MLETARTAPSEDRLKWEMRVTAARRRLPGISARRRIRENAGVSQAAIGEALGVTRLTVWRWERGDRIPRGDLLLRYVELLDRLERAP